MRSKFAGSCLWVVLSCSLSAGFALGCEKTDEPAQGTSNALEVAQPAPPLQPTATPPAVTPPAGARVFFIEPKDGAEVKGPAVDGKVAVTIKMGAENIAVQAAGRQVPGTGHHHLVIDGEHVALGSPVPADDRHIHYGKGQTETSLMLAPGEHRLTMQFADGFHLSYGPQLSSSIKVNVIAEPTGSDSATAKSPPKTQ